jgi:hypothetical protein
MGISIGDSIRLGAGGGAIFAQIIEIVAKLLQ